MCMSFVSRRRENPSLPDALPVQYRVRSERLVEPCFENVICRVKQRQ